MSKHRPENVDSSSGEGEERLVTALPLAPLAFIGGVTFGMPEGAKGGPVEDALAFLVPTEGPFVKPDLAGMAQDRRDTGRGQSVR